MTDMDVGGGGRLWYPPHCAVAINGGMHCWLVPNTHRSTRNRPNQSYNLHHYVPRADQSSPARYTLLELQTGHEYTTKLCCRHWTSKNPSHGVFHWPFPHRIRGCAHVSVNTQYHMIIPLEEQTQEQMWKQVRIPTQEKIWKVKRKFCHPINLRLSSEKYI